VPRRAAARCPRLAGGPGRCGSDGTQRHYRADREGDLLRSDEDDGSALAHRCDAQLAQLVLATPPSVAALIRDEYTFTTATWPSTPRTSYTQLSSPPVCRRTTLISPKAAEPTSRCDLILGQRWRSQQPRL